MKRASPKKPPAASKAKPRAKKPAAALPPGPSKDQLRNPDRPAWIYRELLRLYPDATCALHHNSPFELLVATILSAQCTDERVNKVTPGLFRQYPTIESLAAAGQEEIEQVIRSTGFYRNKAKSIKGASTLLAEKFGSKVPDTMEELLELPGVARKTANVVLGNAFNKAVGFVVDTHISRLSQRLAFTKQKDPVKIEQDLMKLFPSEQWTMLAHLLIFHGRQVCHARKPKCMACTLSTQCPKIGVSEMAAPVAPPKA